MDPLTIGAALIKFAPTIAGWFGGEDAENKVEKAVGIAQAITATRDPQSALDMLEKDGRLALKFEKAILAHEVALAQERTRRIEAVNRTMQEEAKSEHWMQWSWRPFNGFLFGLTLAGNYVVLPLFERPVQTLPETVLMAWAAVLGVTAWHRGMQKREKDGVKKDLQEGLSAMIDRTLR